MKKILLLYALVHNLLPSQACAQQKNFSFGGFALKATAEQLKKSFPNSVMEVSENSTYVRIAAKDTKDGVTSSIIFMRDKKPDVVQMIFEIARDPSKPDSYYRDPLNQNPRCEPILAELKRRYGKPYGPFDNNEEGLVYKDYVWDNEQEKLILTCARFWNSKSKIPWAAAVKIGANRPGYCMHLNCIEPPK
ncbi:hypothetical protein H8K35_14920 [Undibacterium sp. LX40W]|uniref:Uncharacterized protein n=1 Tax=Undibacterium nitidum TaxID=2762298 RepID=A0A923HU68_9BURK|nr:MULTISPECIES: hypothetical protein [Undibacterium]MBC3882682.1 hypothetical protein [Undibacterium nitidum]MBC3892963.1 hypothetical protein [Undibacterium sp. LX40W]